MALGLTFAQSNNGKTLTITEASTNSPVLTGANITITYGGSEVYNTNMTAEWVAGTETTIDIVSSDLGQGADTAITDGIYTIEYTTDAALIPGDGVSYNIVLDYNVKYCVYNMYRELPDVHSCADLCTNSQVQRTEFMGTYLKALEYSAACGQTNEIARILLSLQNLCLNPGINECYCS